MTALATVLTSRPGSAATRARRWMSARAGSVVALGLLAAGAPALGQIAEPTPAEAPGVAQVTGAEDISAGRGPASAPQILAAGPDALTVGWTVESGENEGVYLRRRAGEVWDVESLRIDAATGAAPRDLALASSNERIHGVWTAISGDERRLFLVSLSTDSGLSTPLEVTSPGEGDADYPIVLPRPGGGLWLVWQAARQTDFTIESAEISPRGGLLRRLPAVSGASHSAVAPRALHTHPPVIAWNEIGGDSNRVRVNYFDYIHLRWEDSAMADFLRDVSPERTTVGAVLENTFLPYAFWIDPASREGIPAVSVAQAPASGPAAPPLRVTAPGTFGAIYDQAEMKLINNDTLTLAWRAFDRREQAIHVARVDWPTGAVRVARVSGESAYPSNPAHVSKENWSAVTWADDTADGGTGRLGFAEIQWNGEAAGSF